MNPRFRILFCDRCRRSVPRAAVRCLWCSATDLSVVTHSSVGEPPQPATARPEAARLPRDASQSRRVSAMNI